MKVAVVTAAMQSGERGGAEAFYDGLTNALRAAGHDARQLAVPVDESTFEKVLESYIRCHELDVSTFDLVISTKAPTYLVRHPRHISYLVHTLRVFYDRFESEYGEGTAAQREQRRLIHHLDKSALHPSRILRHCAIGHTCYRRLLDADRWWQQIPFSVLHLPPPFERFKRPRRGSHVLMAGRLHRWKRTDLVVRAFRRIKHDVPLLIAGTGQDEALIRRAAEGDRRIQFLGTVPAHELLDLYAEAIVVPFVPVQEDYGLITLEAFHSRKPVLTCTDSGEPLEFVRDGVTGAVVAPQEDAIADRLNAFIEHPDDASAMGRRGYEAVAHIKWDRVVSNLLNGSAAVTTRRRSRATRASHSRTTKVAVLDMQPIAPAIGGGRLRLLGLYHNLGAEVQTTYVGTYDWPGEPYREHRLSDTLTEIDIPLTAAHFEAAARCQALAGGKTVIDASFPQLAHHSPEYVQRARAMARDADIVVCSHPWIYPLVRDDVDQQRQLLIYDAHNVESVLRHSILGDTEHGRSLVEQTTLLERELCRRADLVLACSHEDRRLFNELYGTPFSRCLVMPNGTFTGIAVDATIREAAKTRLSLAGLTVAIFVGARYQPNEEAATFIAHTLARSLPEVTFVICGGVGDAIDRKRLGAAGISNVHVTGVVDEETRREYFAAADLAINPMFSGSGTNIKMFDFMAAGLPVISTPVGARGIRQTAGRAVHIADADSFSRAITDVLSHHGYRSELAAAGRQLVSERYSWERLSRELGGVLTRHHMARRHRPFFSVVIPTYERQQHLPALLECLRRQQWTDFEVILVDQSDSPARLEAFASALDVVYVHTDVRGATRARNVGAAHARGTVIAFTDDDCRPYSDWLLNARPYFDDRRIVGIEGFIISDKTNDSGYRTVTNAGFEGVGFMTANLLLRRETFNAIDGFDEQFDRPHFREDTDLGWRALALGTIPFAREVCVFHPPHPRSLEREAAAARVRFFEKDALLLKKHPERYKTLFLREGHYANTDGFWEHFDRGAQKYGVNVDAFVSSLAAGQRPPKTRRQEAQ